MSILTLSAEMQGIEEEPTKFEIWLEKKFGKKDFDDEYYNFILKRYDSWGLNTIGCWSAPQLIMKSRKPYVVCVLERAKGVKRHSKFHIYDFDDPDFEENMRSAIRKRFAEDDSLAHAAKDPMCIGFFIDNELQFQKWIPDAGVENVKESVDLYFRICKEELAKVAPGKLYLGSRFVGFRQSGLLWRTAAKYCDVITVNAYANSVYNLSRKMFEEGKLTPEAIQAIMSEQKPNQREKIVLRGDRVRQLIPKNVPLSQTEDFVCKALEHYNNFLRKRAERDSR